MIRGLLHIIDVYKLECFESSRIKTHNKVISKTAEYVDVLARIISEKIVLIEEDIEIAEGDVIYEKTTNTQYNIESVKKVNGLKSFHHLTVEVSKRKVGDIFGENRN